MKKRLGIALVLGVGIVAAGGYAVYDYYMGNHVEVVSVIKPSAEASGGAELSLAEETAWTIDPASEVYLTISTSQDKVNMQAGEVTGDWKLNLKNPSVSAASAKVSLNALQSGNDKRDNHIKGSEYLDTTAYPEALFVSESIEEWPTDLKAGQLFQFKLKGKLTIKGVTKDVTFAMEGQIEDKKIALEGKTTITFSDFNVKAPAAVFSRADEEIEISPRLILVPATAS